jgi:hypothetical protein
VNQGQREQVAPGAKNGLWQRLSSRFSDFLSEAGFSPHEMHEREKEEDASGSALKESSKKGDENKEGDGDSFLQERRNILLVISVFANVLLAIGLGISIYCIRRRGSRPDNVACRARQPSLVPRDRHYHIDRLSSRVAWPAQ